MTESYGVFADYYDALTQNVNYAARAAAIHQLITVYTSEKLVACENDRGLLLDLACGTGSFSEEMAKLGWEVIGVDGSDDMLMQAYEKRAESPLVGAVQYLRQDMRKLDLYGTVSVTLCMLDSINHLPAATDVRQVFSRVGLFTNPGGLFLFDVNTAYKHCNVLKDQCFVYDLPDCFCVWQNQLADKAPHYPVQIRLDFFARQQNQTYRRMSEVFTEQIYPHEMLQAYLAESGFSLLNVLDGDSFDAPTETSQRLLYIARKDTET